MTNQDRANHGSKQNQDRRVEHQQRQVERREKRKLDSLPTYQRHPSGRIDQLTPFPKIEHTVYIRS